MLSDKQLSFFRENGYVKVEGVVPKENCDRVVAAIWECLGCGPDSLNGGFSPPEGVLSGAGMVEMYHHQAMWDNRQHPAVYEVFSRLLGEAKLWVSLDRVNMKPPYKEKSPGAGTGFIHWDRDTANLPSPIPRPYGVQGVLYLADTAENQGGFQCVPGIYRELEAYLRAQPADRNPRVPNLDGYEVEVIPGKAGDLVIWDTLLPHGNGRNDSDRPRYAQYITMFPARPESTEMREGRIAEWRSRRAPGGYAAFPGDPRSWESKRYEGPPELTPLGRRLLGLDLWEE